MTKTTRLTTVDGQQFVNKRETENAKGTSNAASTAYQAVTGGSAYAHQQTATSILAYAASMKMPWPSENKPKPHIGAHLPRLIRSMVPNTPLMECLYRALTVRRNAGGQGEAKFVAWLANRLPVTMIDGAGNLHVDTREGPRHRTMLTAHTDTVHYMEGENIVRYDATNPDAIVWRADEGQCLGADDGAGVALLYHMIVNGFKGYVVFFREEECGGHGSKWLASNMPELLSEFDRCVSLDRAGKSDVITHQAGGRCCSDTFADALASALTTDDMSMCYFPDATGVFTDSANLTEHVPECTNLSIAYASQHGDHEYQDVAFLQRLAIALVSVDWEALPTERDPKEEAIPVYRGTTYPIWDKQTLAQWGSGGMGAKLEDSIEDALMDALDGKHAPLRMLLAEWLDPQDPNGAERYIDVRKIKPTTIERYLDQYLCGMYDNDSLLDELVTKATIV